MMSMTDPRILKRFHKDLVTLKAHHWKNFFDLYRGCLHDCSYCLYRYDEVSNREIQPIKGVNTDQLVEELDAVKPAGISYLGAISDVYQPIEEKLRLTRSILEIFCEKHLPLFLTTKASLVLRDIDLLLHLASEGLVEVSITIITLDEWFAKALEPGVPSPKERLDVAKELTKNGIPVSFHVAPLIPGYFTDEKLRELVFALRETGANGIYSCILGMRRTYRDHLLEHIHETNPTLADYLQQIYLEEIQMPNALSPLTRVVFEEMSRLSTLCKACNFGFYCENIPPLDTNSREGNIFRSKLPTVGDMYRYFVNQGIHEVHLDDLRDYLNNFPAIDEEYQTLITKLWQQGILFQDTYFAPVRHKSSVIYILKENLDLQIGEIMTCD